MAENQNQVVQKTIFEENGQMRRYPKQKKMVLKKKKKQIIQVRPIIEKPIPATHSTYSINNKSFQQMIIEAKKPIRMPPNIQPKVQSSEEESCSSDHEQVYQELIFHKPGVNILAMKNRKRKKLFEVEENNTQIMQEQIEGQESVFNKLRREDKLQKEQEELRAKQLFKIIKPKTKEQLMIQKLKQKYADRNEIQQPMPPVMPGSAYFQPNYPGNMQPNYPTNFQPNYQSNYPGNIQSSIYQNLSGTLPSNIVGNLQPNFQPTVQPNLSGMFPSNIPGNNLPLNIPGNLQQNFQQNILPNVPPKVASNIAGSLYSKFGGNYNSSMGENLQPNFSGNFQPNFQSSFPGSFSLP